MSHRDDEAEVLRADVQAVYECCYSAVLTCFVAGQWAKGLSNSKGTTDRRESARGILGMLRELTLDCISARQRFGGVEPFFRAAFPPPCVVNSTPQHSYHEGVLQLAEVGFLGQVAAILGKTPIHELILHQGSDPAEMPFLSRNELKAWLAGNGRFVDEPHYGDMHEQIAIHLDTVQKHLAKVEVDQFELHTALDKEVAKVQLLLARSVADVRDVTPWSKPHALAEWAQVFGESRNTLSKRFKEMQQAEQAKKNGRFWQLDQRQVPVSDDWDQWGSPPR